MLLYLNIISKPITYTKRHVIVPEHYIKAYHLILNNMLIVTEQGVNYV